MRPSVPPPKKPSAIPSSTVSKLATAMKPAVAAPKPASTAPKTSSPSTLLKKPGVVSSLASGGALKKPTATGASSTGLKSAAGGGTTAKSPSTAASAAAVAKAAAEEEEKKRVEAAAAAEQAALQAAEKAALEAQRNGTCTVRYNHYKKPIQVSNGETTSFLVDAQLCLSFVFKSCQLHLIETDPEGKAPAGEGASSMHWVPERPGLPPANEEESECTCRSTIYTLKAGCTYWAVVEEDSAEKAAADARAREGMEKYRKEQEAREAAKAAGGGGTLAPRRKLRAAHASG